MQELADMELLRQYAHRNSEEAFAALVARYVNVVYSVALRKTGSAHAAEEITQAVFIILAKKAGRLREGTILSGWLYQTARLTSAGFLRTEIRRARREQEAYMQSLGNDPEAKVWAEIEPFLEDAMGRLGDKDRNALALRFFEGKNFQEIAGAFGTTENAAKKRVGHALEKLRKFFAKRGVSSTTATIAAAISTNSVQAAPAALAKSVTTLAIAKGATASTSTLTLIKGALKIMAWTKIKFAALTGLVALLIAGSTVIVAKAVESRSSSANADEFRILPCSSVGKILAGASTDLLLAEFGGPDRRYGTNGLAWDYEHLGLTVFNGTRGIFRVVCGDLSGTNAGRVSACQARTEEGIGMGSTRAEIIRAFGPPVTAKFLDAGREQLDYKSYGLVFVLKEGKIIFLQVDFPAIADGATGAIYYIRSEAFFDNLERAANPNPNESREHTLTRYFVQNKIAPAPFLRFDERTASQQGITNLIRILAAKDQMPQISRVMNVLMKDSSQH